MPAIIISSISESTGKTAVAAALVAHLRDQRQQVNVVADLGDLFNEDSLVSFVDADDVDASDDALTIVEGASGAPASDLELAEKLDAHVVLICKFEDDVAEAAPAYGDRLAGVIFNKTPRYRDTHMSRRVEELRNAGVSCLGYIPEDRRLAAPTISSIVQQLDGDTLIAEEGLNNLIDNYLIGGFILDWGPFYFRSEENTCVLARTGRPDVQISALQSNTTRALLLTGGGRPIEYVLYEARTKRIPLIVVPSNTEETMKRLDEMHQSTFHHQEKLDRMIELMSENSMISELAGVLAEPATR